MLGSAPSSRQRPSQFATAISVLRLYHTGYVLERGCTISRNPYCATNQKKLTVQKVFDLGHLSTGGTQLLGPIVEGHLYSEPDFELQFSGTVKHAADYLTSDPGTDGIARPSCVGEIVPDDGDESFLFRITGIDTSSSMAVQVFSNKSSTGLAVPYGYSYSGEQYLHCMVLTLTCVVESLDAHVLRRKRKVLGITK